MAENRILSPAQDEEAELEAAAEWLARSPRLAKLLRYIGEKYFRGEIDQLKEYNIATEVFARPANYFNAGDDAIARVEIHRLRKRLKEFYESEGRNHRVQVCIPPGTYVPVFRRRTTLPEEPSRQEPINQSEGPQKKTEPAQAPHPAQSSPNRDRGIWPYVMAASLAVALIIVAVQLYRSRKLVTTGTSALQVQHQPKAANAPLTPVAAATVPLRLMAGYNGAPHVDSSGHEWGPDRYFEGGRSLLRGMAFAGRTNRPVLFQQWRNGEFSYNIPLKPGVYELHLYFVESSYGPGLEETDRDDTFSVHINDAPVLGGFDIESDALGANIADERVFKDVHPASDGKLHIAFQGEKGLPILNAIELLPGIPNKQIPIRLTTQSTSFVDHAGQFWRADDYYLDGLVSPQPHPVSGTSDPSMFANERFGHFTYAIPVDVHGQYTVTLHFAEFYFGPQAPGGGGIGSRIFNVMCNGVLLLDHFDIFKEAGSFHALTKTFYHVMPTAQGKLNLTFEPVANNATISGIEVLDESH
jgi:hypothetical protein